MGKPTFEHYLGINSREKKWRGLKLMTVSFLVAMAGVAIGFFGLGVIGYSLAVLGMVGGVVGIAMHWYAMFTAHRGG